MAEAGFLWTDDYHDTWHNPYILGMSWDTVAAFISRGGLHTQWFSCMCKAQYSNMAFIALETAHAVHFFLPSQYMFMYFCFLLFRLPFSLPPKTCSKLRLKLPLLRDRCRDELLLSELFIASRRSNKIGSCRTGIHVITAGEVITRLALVQAFCLPKHRVEV